VVLGLLVTARSDRPWGEGEQDQIERVARTLAIACVLDRRAAWTDHNLHQLQQLQAQQHELFDNLLHQFRNPLMALRTFGKVLLKRLAPNNKSRDLAEGIIRESEHLQDLLKQFEQVVNLQPVELLPGEGENLQETSWQSGPKALAPSSGKVPLLPGVNALTPAQLQLVSCEITDILQPLLNSARAIAQDRRIQLLVLVPEMLSTIQADAGALREALNNLIDNALKYTPSGGKVEVLAGLRRQRNGTNFQGIAIIDNGPGIPQSDQTRLFERHFRGIQATSDIPGTGLGLAITQDLIQRMRGAIEAFSPAGASGLLPEGEDSDRGTAFIVWLPED
jgi:signal transduction histidine kinase